MFNCLCTCTRHCMCGALETYLPLFPVTWLSRVCCLAAFYEGSEDLSSVLTLV